MWHSAITNAGAQLLERMSGGALLIIDGASAATGSVDTASLLACTALTGEEYSVPAVKSKWTETGLRYDIQFSAVEKGYTARQIGIWAHIDGDAGKTLFAILQGDEGIEIPTIAQHPSFVFSMQILLTIRNDGQITVVTDASQYVPWAEFNAALENIEIKIDDTVTEAGENAVTGAAVYAFVEGYVREAVPEKVPAAHVTAGTLAGQVQANAAAAAVTGTAQLRNIVMLAEDPGDGAAVDYPDGTVIHVYG